MKGPVWIQDINGTLYNISKASMLSCLEKANMIQVSYGTLTISIHFYSKEETLKAWDFILKSLPNRFIVSPKPNPKEIQKPST